MWRNLRALTLREWGLVWEMVFVCVGVQVGLCLMPVSRFLSLLRHLPDHPQVSAPFPMTEFQRFAAACFRRAPWRMSCLAQSLVLLTLLRRRGLPARVRIGLAKHGERLRAHAWVEHDGQVLLDDPAIPQQFQSVMSLVSAG